MLSGTIHGHYPTHFGEGNPGEIYPFRNVGVSATKQHRGVVCDIADRPAVLPAYLSFMPELKLEAKIEGLDGTPIRIIPEEKDPTCAYAGLMLTLHCLDMAPVFPGN